MESLYHVPAEKFQHVTAAGTPEDVAERLSGYVAGGAEHLTLIPVADSVEAAVDLVAEVRTLLHKRA
jgi:alkanesulfonate monooxygenase SsuD/methylene tetrahydromethanopterin reductase-like flavin-dependent oxidoreductase (luciferase family)